jgi:hypothetical protein
LIINYNARFMPGWVLEACQKACMEVSVMAGVSPPAIRSAGTFRTSALFRYSSQGFISVEKEAAPFSPNFGSYEHEEFPIFLFIFPPQTVISIIHDFTREVLDTDVAVLGQSRQ